VDKQALMQQLKATFLDELSEHVESLNRGLLALEKDPADKQRAELLKSLFRAAHTLKGASAAVCGGPLPDVCHQLEEILSAVQQNRFQFSPELFALLFRTVDGIEEAGMRLRDEQDLEDSPLHALLLDLETAAAEGAAPTAPTRAPIREAPSDEVPQPPAKQPVAGPSAVSAAAASMPAPAAAQPTSPVKPATKEPPPPGKTAAATLRVAAEKLDSLMAQSGELLVARRRVELRSVDVEQIRDLVAAWRREWRGVELPLRQLLSSGTAGTDGMAGTEAARRFPALPRRAAAAVSQNGERLRQLERKLEQVAANMAADGRLLGQTCDGLDDEVEHLRMFPFAEACAGLERIVRDVARSAGKEVRLVIEGGDVEVDRSVLEGLKDPLLHLVRNAVDHGIEGPEQRERSGKPRQATVTVSAALRGTQVEVVVGDDGRGFDLDRIRDKLRQKGLPEPPDERELVRTVFLPGFSTAPIITEVSGRGVGLDVVQNRIEALHGTVDVAFETGRGARFILSVPLTLTKIRCVLLVSGGQTYAIATVHVVKLLRISPDELRSVAARDTLSLGDSPTCVSSLTATLGSGDGAARQGNGKLLAFVLTSGIQRAAFVVDEVLGEQEIVVKNLGARIRRLRHVSGGSLLPSGWVALVLNVPSLIRAALGSAGAAKILAEEKVHEPAAKRLLVVDDSVTTRTLLKSILETAGYAVATAADGEQAWQLLSGGRADLVVTDVDMPRLDGFQLTRKIRNSDRHRKLPVILVTARETDQDKARGVEVGANAYLLKSGFDQRSLLECIAQLT
jgi:two-component system chemotaxis sensor kinase CheA